MEVIMMNKNIVLGQKLLIHEDGSFEGRKERQTKKILFEDKNELLSHLHDTVEAILEKDIEDRNN